MGDTARRENTPARGVRRPLALAGVAAVAAGIVLAGVLSWRFQPPALPVAPVGGGPLRSVDPVPWRDPDGDLRRFFPGADGYHEEARLLSGERPLLQRRLGRTPGAEEHRVLAYRVHRGGQPVGTVLLRRVRGPGGAIELVLAVGEDGRLRGLRLQRHREPPSVAAFLVSPVWRSCFLGRRAEDLDRAFRSGGLDACLPHGPGRESARILARAVRDALVVLEVARERGLPEGSHHPVHP